MAMPAAPINTSGAGYTPVNPGFAGKNLPTGPPVFIPSDPSSTAVFDPVTQKTSIPTGVNRGPFPGSPLQNPFGYPYPNQHFGRSTMFGGPQDIMKSIATRGVALSSLVGQLNRPDQTADLVPGLQAAAGQMGGRLGSEQFANMSPAIGTAFGTYGDEYKQNLIGMLGNAYTLGGGLWGSQAQAWAQAKQQEVRRRMAHAAAINAILGSVEGSLTGGGGGMGGMGGGGGGGGGMNDWGSGQFSQGMVDIGALGGWL
jgi:hypothetical protein